MLETISCVAIIAIVAALLTPVFRSAKLAGQVTASVSNLHQMHLALLLYQAKQGESSDANSISAMGFPTVYQLDGLGLPAKVWKSPCGRNPSWFPAPITKEYEYFASTSLTQFDDAYRHLHDRTTMFIDMNCAEHGDPLISDYIPHRALGVQMSGALLRLLKPGDYMFQAWWADSESQH